mgnify:FL=1
MKHRKQEPHPLLDALVAQMKGPEDFKTMQDLLLKRGIEALLKAEMNEYLGYSNGGKPIDGNLRNGFSEKTIKTSSGHINPTG